jgi:signal transduction histidine kinase
MGELVGFRASFLGFSSYFVVLLCASVSLWLVLLANQVSETAMTLRQRMLLTLAPFVCLLGAVAGTGFFLLRSVGDSIERILKENYRSVVAMVGLNEALERIDSSFQFAVAGRDDAREMYESNWGEYNRHLDTEQHNVTEPGEQDLVDRLTALTQEYHRRGDHFFTETAGAARKAAYFGTPARPGLFQSFQDIKTVTETIRVLNQRSMEAASARARHTAAVSQIALAAALVFTVLLAGLLAWRTVRAVMGPIQMLTQSAVAVGLGDLHHIVPVVSRDEIGQLAEAFNRMTRQIQGYRQSHSARLLRAQRTSQATIDSFPDPVLVVEPGGRVEMANPAARLLLGIPESRDGQPPEFVWQPPEALRHPLHEALTAQKRFLTQAYDQTLTFRLGGDEHAYLPQVLPINDPFGETLGAAVVLNDVTRFRLLDQVKSDLVATVSHELKTPLTSVRLALHLLLEETVGPLTPKQTELLVDARENAERLLNVIEHLLGLARLEQGGVGLQLEPVPPQELLQAAADTARSRAEDKHIELVVADAAALPEVAADRERLGHALNNLLDNALTYTDAGDRVTLSAEADGPDAVRLSVRDTGMGIPPEYLPFVFDKFFRVPGRGHGTGLGLAIVREVVTAHHGETACESEPGRGTVFHITLPLWENKS